METAGFILRINIAEQSVTVTEPETVTVLKSGLQKPICLLLTVHKQFFLYPVCARVCVRARVCACKREKCFLKNIFDVDSQSQINMLTLQRSLSAHAHPTRTHVLGNLNRARNVCFSFYHSVHLCFVFSPPFSTVGFHVRLRACSFLILQKRTVWNMLSSPGRAMHTERNLENRNRLCSG